VELRHAELLNEDGTLNMAPSRNAEATDIYILKGEGTEVYEPRFTYHGFRYVDLTGYPGVPRLSSIEACFVHTDVESSGEFYCSNELINKIHGNVRWGQLSNLMSIPTDCPQRDERYGWMGDAHLSCEEAIFNFDMAAFYTNFLRQIQLSQKEDGNLPDVVPAYFDLFYPADPAWGSAYVIIAWYMFLFYQDQSVIEQHYVSIKKYVQFLRDNSEDHIVRKLAKYGDWCPPGSITPKKTPVELTATWYYYYDTLLLSKMANAIGRVEDSEFYSKMAEEIKHAFNNAFLNEEGYLAHKFSPVDTVPSQTSNVLPLYLSMVPEDRSESVLGALLQSVINEQDNHLDTGILGTRYILDVLTQNGHPEVAYKIATQRSYPGWGYMVEEGATTLWERWENVAGSGMNSHNHIMLGSVDAWFYRAIAGMSLLKPGWSRIRIRPYLVGDLKFASAEITTVKGQLRVSWERGIDFLDLWIEVPVGVEAEVHVPLLWSEAQVTESDKIIWEHGSQTGNQADSVSFVGHMDRNVVFKVKSGLYSFTLRNLGRTLTGTL
jgi:alpha-L-rhamnosidase